MKISCCSLTICKLPGKILKRGYNAPKLMPMACMIETTDAYVVNFDSVIYKCPAFIGQKGFAVGNLQTGVSDYSSIYKLGIWKNQGCAGCEYLPLCFGGCRYMASEFDIKHVFTGQVF